MEIRLTNDGVTVFGVLNFSDCARLEYEEIGLRVQRRHHHVGGIESGPIAPPQ